MAEKRISKTALERYERLLRDICQKKEVYIESLLCIEEIFENVITDLGIKDKVSRIIDIDNAILELEKTKEEIFSTICGEPHSGYCSYRYDVLNRQDIVKRVLMLDIRSFLFPKVQAIKDKYIIKLWIQKTSDDIEKMFEEMNIELKEVINSIKKGVTDDQIKSNEFSRSF